MDEELNILVYKSSKDITQHRQARFIEELGRYSEAISGKFTESFIESLIKESERLESVFITDWDDKLVMAIKNGVVTTCYDEELRHYLNNKYSTHFCGQNDVYGEGIF